MKLFKPRIPFKEKMFFVEHLAVMLRAAIPIDRALDTLAEQTDITSFKTILIDIRDTVRKGSPFSQGLKQHAGAFGSLFISMVEAGEYSGKLEEGLRRLYVQMKKDYDLRARVTSALVYPAFIVVAMIGIGTAMMVFVMPKLIPLFDGFGAQLPIATRILIGLSKFITNYIFWIIPVTIIGSILLIHIVRTRLRVQWHAFLLHIPMMGTLIKKINLARFARTLGTLLTTDILVPDALLITANIMGIEQYKKVIRAAAEEIKRGIPIAEALKKERALFPPTVHTMIQIGEEAGTLTDLLEEIATFYEESVDESTKALASIIEPALIILLGAGVGGIALAILMPMYALMQQV